MKFITEDDLRILFRREPFASYDLPAQAKLTPGARQFLLDKKISFCDDPLTAKRKTTKPAEVIVETPITEPVPDRFLLKLETLKAQFLEAGISLLDRDVLLAEQVFDLERKLSFVGKGAFSEINPFEPCTGFNKENQNEPYSDCFEITGFHAQSEKGREIVLLHRLRCCVRELAAEAGEKNFNPVINRLSQMICLLYGGNACQRKK
jgi:ethanolamine utilization cobalamin adenosyltransferase